jgi:hypothetical protein
MAQQTSSYSSTKGTETAISNRPVPTKDNIANEAPRLDRNAASRTLVSRTTVSGSGMRLR